MTPHCAMRVRPAPRPQDSSVDPLTLELIVQMTTKPMQLALYFCTGEATDVEQWR